MLKILALLFVVALAWVAGPLTAQTQDDVAKGQSLSDKFCAGCHMRQAQGEKLAAQEVPGFRAIAKRPDQTVNDIVRWLGSMPAQMPNHNLTTDEMYALASYIMSLRAEGGKRGP
jgi:mono/diheme cytochrome c family protein